MLNFDNLSKHIALCVGVFSLYHFAHFVGYRFPCYKLLIKLLHPVFSLSYPPIQNKTMFLSPISAFRGLTDDAYKDGPELSISPRRRSSDVDLSIEKTLLVNPNCPVRIMLEYIRKRCRLGVYTQFDLSDESGTLKGLFSMPTYVYATDQFEHKKTYYVIVIRQETDKRISVIPQVNHENKLFLELKAKVKKFITTGEVSPVTVSPAPAPQPPTPVSRPSRATRKK